ncbi:MAG TPA: TonB-dependent receptor [Chitinophagaceae bacterium]|nr:TonB-dependent receptor [Chitinophagaceae bacterium]
MNRILVLLLSVASITATAQNRSDTILPVKTLDEVIFSANKFQESKRNIAQRIDVVSAKFISKVNAQNTGDLLINTGNVFVQKSQQGGSSPVIRGFEASRILLVVDGIRMNNAVYRAGHLQNVITVDQNMLERVEVMYGPSSTLYGSDALGGLVHMITKPVLLAKAGEHSSTRTNAFLRYSSANNEKTAHVDVNLGYKKFGFLTGATFSDFGDMRMGDNYPDKYPDFGRRSSYVTQINNSFVDSIVKNDDDRVQKFSGYMQWDLMQKFLYQQSEKVTHSLNLQHSNTNNVPRYDRLQDIRNGALRYAEWFYGPQTRSLIAYNLTAKNVGTLIHGFKATLSYQDIEESRQQRDYRRYDRFDSRREHIKVWGLVADMFTKFGNNELTVGADAQLNDVKSVADRTNLSTGAVTALDTRYPNGENDVNYFGIYAQHTLKMSEGKWVLNDGLRLQMVNLHSTIADNSFFQLPVTDVKQSPTAITGNLGIIYMPVRSTKIALSLTSGFRAPNIDDMARVFESSTALMRVVIPNADIKPEYTYGADLGITHSFNDYITFEVSGYYTLFRNAIALAPFSLNGQDSIIYNGIRSQVVANQNVNKAYLYGFHAGVNATVSYFNFSSTISYSHGRYKTNPKNNSAIYEKQANGTYQLVQRQLSKKPMDHIPPIFGKTSVEYRNKAITAEVYVMYNGWKKLDDYNADGEDNQQYATADGMPSWYTLNFRSGIQINKNILLQASVENIFDRNYRYFGSGFSAAGKNFILALRAGF